MSLLQRVRDTGRYPPSLLSDERSVGDVGFDALISRVLDPTPNSISLSSDPDIASDLQKVLEMCSGIEKIPGEHDSGGKTAALEQRRCVVLAILASTSPDSKSLKAILSNGLLSTLKLWLEDILAGSVGSIDLLLSFLSSIEKLPVTKSQVRDSGMGKKVGSIEKHRICAGTPNESPIKTRVQAVKDSWNTSVKVNKDQDSSADNKKRALEDTTGGAAKRPKSEANNSSFSNLLKKVSNSPTSNPNVVVAKQQMTLKAWTAPSLNNASTDTSSSAKTKAKKSSKRVKWADHFGGNLENARQIDGNNGEQPVPVDTDEGINVSWSDRRKRDRLREKELLAQAKKKKLIDDNDDDDIFSTTSMKPTCAWHSPSLTPERTDVTKTPVDSKEQAAQVLRMTSVSAVHYSSESMVPKNPFPMSDVESALDLQSAQSAAPSVIPFFVPQAPQPAPVSNIAAFSIPAVQVPGQYTAGIPSPIPPVSVVGASAEMVQAMGLPLFLVGSNVQALQTIASNPSLLSTFVDANGMYDQTNLMALVQTLSQSLPNQPQAQQTQVYGSAYAPQQSYPNAQTYAPAMVGTAVAPTYGQSSHYGPVTGPSTDTSQGRSGYRGDQNLSEANLHVAGYGPTATQVEIINLFAPYVHVKEVVMKNGFCFVNTSDPVGAKVAKEALSGALVAGQPIRINMAQRRSRDSTPSVGGSVHVQAITAISTTPTEILPRNSLGEIDYSSIRDDRGNPATKNLFVAGYGPGSTELQIRELFSQYATITGCVMKGNFCFVNTTDRNAAVQSREALSGFPVNGGSLRINFAKETGRLGTSFDLTYGPGTAPGPAPVGRSYYGR